MKKGKVKLRNLLMWEGHICQFVQGHEVAGTSREDIILLEQRQSFPSEASESIT